MELRCSWELGSLLLESRWCCCNCCGLTVGRFIAVHAVVFVEDLFYCMFAPVVLLLLLSLSWLLLQFLLMFYVYHCSSWCFCILSCVLTTPAATPATPLLWSRKWMILDGSRRILGLVIDFRGSSLFFFDFHWFFWFLLIFVDFQRFFLIFINFWF